MGRFDDAYAQGTPPWDIGRPQGAIVRAADAGAIGSPVLDVGCGTGENALFLAARGLEVWGVDVAPAAIIRAQEKARARNLPATFRVADALDLGALGRTFQSAIDSGVFHVFDDADRARYVASLAAALRPGGTYVMLVFSDREPTEWGGPRRIREDEIRAAFWNGWAIESLVPERFETNFHPGGSGHAWLAVIRRV
jgi:SAM-dependent methyltransferase